MRNNNGNITIGLLFLLVVLTAITLNVRRMSVATTWLSSAITKSELILNREEIAHLENLELQPSSGLNCTSLNRNFCYLKQDKQNLPTKISNSRLPYFNYSSYFSSPLPCSKKARANPYKTYSGITLSRTSYQSSHNCINPEEYNGYFEENLVASTVLFLEHYLYTAGSIEISSLDLKSDSTIIAGGDIYIELLKSKIRHFITIISTSGRIVINQIEGYPRFRLYAFRDIEAPENLVYSELAPTPKLSAITHIGIY